ncbi:MAG: superoxide dismutase family protein [Planctomycetota bacterium]
MRLRSLGLLALALATPACVFVHAKDDGHGDHAASGGHDAAAHAHATGETAEATIEARSDAKLTGKATFTEVQGGVLVTIEVHHAAPGWHAAHVHDKGDCSAPDASSAGGHFNPATKNHGSPHAPEHHAGDLGNLWVDANGDGHHVILMPELTVAAGEHSVRGRAIIVHAGVDDLVTQPTGNAGGRIGCGVIR